MAGEGINPTRRAMAGACGMSTRYRRNMVAQSSIIGRRGDWRPLRTCHFAGAALSAERVHDASDALSRATGGVGRDTDAAHELKAFDQAANTTRRYLSGDDP